MISNEIAQVRKTTKMISQFKIALEQIQQRLESTIDLRCYGGNWPAMGALTKVRTGNWRRNARSRQRTWRNQWRVQRHHDEQDLCQTSFAFDASGEEVDRILAEVGAVAEQRMSDSFPTSHWIIFKAMRSLGHQQASISSKKITIFPFSFSKYSLLKYFFKSLSLVIASFTNFTAYIT